jgi:hypothetical protein
LQAGAEVFEKPLDALLLDGDQRHGIDAGRAAVLFDSFPWLSRQKVRWPVGVGLAVSAVSSFVPV